MVRSRSLQKTMFPVEEKPCEEKARHFAIFLLMRYTGCRISEALAVDDVKDLNFVRGEVTLLTLKRRKRFYRTVPLPGNVVAEFGRLLARWPELRGSLFRRHRSTVFKVFRARAEEAEIAEELRHPHVLRHTRAIELLNAGVPINLVQKFMGHASVATTAIYLCFNRVDLRMAMKAKGLI